MDLLQYIRSDPSGIIDLVFYLSDTYRKKMDISEIDYITPQIIVK